MTNGFTGARGSLLAFLLVMSVIPVALPGAAQAEPEPYRVQDAHGDVWVSGIDRPAIPPVPNPVTDQYDIVEIGIAGEDEIGMNFYLKAADFKAASASFYGHSWTGYNLHAKLEGTRVEYELSWFPELPVLGDTETLQGVAPVKATFCVQEEQQKQGHGPGGGCGAAQRVDGTINWDTSMLNAYVTKAALMGRDGDQGYGGNTTVPDLTRDMRLGSIYAEYVQSFPPVRDRVPDTDYAPQSYVFRSISANTKIRMQLASDENAGGDGLPFGQGYGGDGPNSQKAGEVSVVPGVSSLVPIRVQNTNPGKRIINLSFEFKNPDASTQWTAQLAPQITVPGRDARTVNLVINASNTLHHRDATTLVVRGVSLVYHDELAALRLNLVASVPPSPEKPTLFFHAHVKEGNPALDAWCSLAGCKDFEGWLNTLETDPLANVDDGLDMQARGMGLQSDEVRYELGFRLDTPLTRDVVLDVAKPIEFQFAFKTDAEFTATLELQVSAGFRTIGESSSTATFRTGTPIAVSVTPFADAERITVADGKILVHMVIRASPLGAGALAVQPNFVFVPQDSSIDLPIIPDPNAAFVKFLAGPALLTLTTPSSVEDFVNPTEARLFNATVTNEGLEPDEAHIRVAFNLSTWRVEVLPGTDYALAPGESAKFGLMVFAPADASEGELFHLVVNVTSGNDPNQLSQLRFTVLATSADVPDDTGRFVVDEESRQKVRTAPQGNSPSLGVPVALLTLAGLIWSQTRRRRH